ncbi:helix-turn-helix transcriptional regulator [Pectobacterium versatile]|uniref:helix-turn-helix transcriptional regulator n=1 Tax=Pectobacterium versatile TaxID=2488639 RepID=UPI001CD0843F|nr:helix-turn-helix domain-containing protein [Pectobacterium versatile]
MKSLIDRIADGEATLLGIDDICARLGISRSTLERWVRNGSRASNRLKELAEGMMQNGAGLPASIRPASVTGGMGLTDSMLDTNGSSSDNSIVFPAPDIKIGQSPKWELQTFKDWLSKNSTV